MADETDNENPETVPSPEGEEGSEQAPAGETGGGPTDATSAEPEGASAEESEQDGAGAAADAPAPGAPAGEPETEQLAPKERRRRSRSKHTGEVRPSRSPEERHAERVAERRTKAARRRARRLSERSKATARRAAAGPREALAPVHPIVEGTRKVRQGVVISNKAEKTITVRIDVAHRHRRYEKVVRSSGTVHAHDENNDAREGDIVRVVESRPLSRTKRWALVDVVERAR
jgi:small subunit ribosomal protein S17